MIFRDYPWSRLEFLICSRSSSTATNNPMCLHDLSWRPLLLHLCGFVVFVILGPLMPMRLRGLTLRPLHLRLRWASCRTDCRLKWQQPSSNLMLCRRYRLSRCMGNTSVQLRNMSRVLHCPRHRSRGRGGRASTRRYHSTGEEARARYSPPQQALPDGQPPTKAVPVAMRTDGGMFGAIA